MTEKNTISLERVNILKTQSALLDKILDVQKNIHLFVSEKDWEKLSFELEKFNSLSSEFASLEEKRESVCKGSDVFREKETAPYAKEIRAKLNKSKIENKVLNEYISTTQKFLQGVFDEVVPQRRNVLYSKTGKIVKPELNSVVLNQIV